MAKKKTKTQTKAPRRRRVRQAVGLSPYQELLVNPCTALPASPYGGERGIVERFVSDFSVGAAGNTCGFHILYPGSNVVGSNSNTASNLATVIPTAAAVAGGFFPANVRKARTIAACTELIPASLSITNITGELAMGIFDQTTFLPASSYTVDAIFTNCNDREVLQKRDYEIKWYPGASDHLYSARQGALASMTAAEPASSNVLVIAWRGIPAGTILSFRNTIVYEWTPEPGLGLAVTSAPGRPINWETQSSELHEASPGWWKNGSSVAPAVPTSQMNSFAGRMRYVAGHNSITKGLHSYLSDGQAFYDAFNMAKKVGMF